MDRIFYPLLYKNQGRYAEVEPLYVETLEIENQKKAIALLPDGESGLRTGMEEALAKFEAALKGGGE